MPEMRYFHELKIGQRFYTASPEMLYQRLDCASGYYNCIDMMGNPYRFNHNIITTPVNVEIRIKQPYLEPKLVPLSELQQGDFLVIPPETKDSQGQYCNCFSVCVVAYTLYVADRAPFYFARIQGEIGKPGFWELSQETLVEKVDPKQMYRLLHNER